MKRIVLTLTILSVMFAGVRPAAAGDWNYQAGYSAPYQQQNRETLKKVLVGGALIGLGFLAGRLSAPRPNYGYGYHPQQGPQFQPQYPPQLGQPTFYRGPQAYHGHRF